MEEYLEKCGSHGDYASKQSSLAKVTRQENDYRALFAKDRSNPVLDNQNLFMIPVHSLQQP